MLRAVLLIPFVAVASMAAAQPWDRNVEALTVSVSTSAPVYAEGEPIEIRVTIANPTDSLAVVDGIPGCMAWFVLDDFESQPWTPCILISLPIEFPPYSSRTTVWSIDPLDLGVPLTGGEHQLVGYAVVGEADTTSFQAPAAMGGRVYFTGRPGLTHDDLGPLRDSLDAEVLFEADGSVSGRISGQWRVQGAPLDSIVARYAGDSRFQNFEAFREMHPPEEVFVAQDDAPRVLNLTVTAQPNPASQTVELAIRAPAQSRVQIDVFDARGRRVAERSGVRDAVRLDLRDWPAGVYTARAWSGTASSTARFTVVR